MKPVEQTTKMEAKQSENIGYTEHTSSQKRGTNQLKK